MPDCHSLPHFFKFSLLGVVGLIQFLSWLLLPVNRPCHRFLVARASTGFGGCGGSALGGRWRFLAGLSFRFRLPCRCLAAAWLGRPNWVQPLQVPGIRVPGILGVSVIESGLPGAASAFDVRPPRPLTWGVLPRGLGPPGGLDGGFVPLPTLIRPTLQRLSAGATRARGNWRIAAPRAAAHVCEPIH